MWRNPYSEGKNTRNRGRTMEAGRAEGEDLRAKPKTVKAESTFQQERPKKEGKIQIKQNQVGQDKSNTTKVHDLDEP